MTRPAAYLRKSKDAATKKDHLDLLMRAVLDAGLDTEPVIYDDWARSGDIAKLATRTGWRAMCDAIERGEHDTVFMNAFDRGGRSLEEWLRFARLCRDRGVRVIAGGVDYAAPENRDRVVFEAWMAEKELDRAKERSATTKKIRAARGDVVIGGHHAPYGKSWVRDHSTPCPSPGRCRCRVILADNPAEPVEPLLEAIRDTGGNVLRAAQVLNDRGVATRSGRSWDPRVLSRALDRAGEPRARMNPGAGGRRRAPTTAPLSKLVVCHCGRTMTPQRDPRNKQWLSLVCGAGAKEGFDAHGRYVARSRHVIEALKEALKGQDRRTYREARASDEDIAARRAKLDVQKRRLGMALADDAIEEDEYRRRMDAVKRELDELAEVVADRGPAITLLTRKVEWDAEDAMVGEQLRARVRFVKVGADMTPVEVSLR